MKQFIFGFVVGGGLFGATTYFVLKKKHDKEIKEMREKEEARYKEMDEYYREKYSVKNAVVIKEDPSEIVKRYEEETKRYQGSDISSAKNTHFDPAELERPSEDSDESLNTDDIPDAPDEYYEEASDEDIERRSVAEGMMADVYNKMNHNKAPEIISEEEFGSAPGFVTEDCVYYVEDLVFCGENEEIIDDEGRAFGVCVNEWKENHEMTDTIYIRNYGRGVDYRVDKMFCKCPAWLGNDE